MRVKVVSEFRQYAIGSELDISESLYKEHMECFLPIIRLRANTGLTNNNSIQINEEE